MYNDKRVLILRHASLLCNIGPINGSSELHGLANQVRAELKSLEVVGRTNKDMLNDIVCSVMISNLDRDTGKGWNLNNTGTETPTIELMRFITKAAKYRGMNEIVPAWGTSHTNPPCPGRSRGRPKPIIVRESDRSTNPDRFIIVREHH